MNKMLTFLLLISLSFFTSASNLPDDFYKVEPRIQLYMAYAEFKMGNHQTAILMWRHIGSSEALFNLANMHTQGIGVPLDIDHGVELYKQAAKEGSRAATFQLGLIYLNDPKLKDTVLAKHWLSLAAMDGDEEASQLLADLDAGVSNKDPLQQVDKFLRAGLHEQALGLLHQLSNGAAPDYRAITRLAWLYESGLAVERDIERAGRLFLLAARHGNAEAQYAVAVMFRTGKGQAADNDQAAFWLQQSASRGYQPAIELLGSSE